MKKHPNKHIREAIEYAIENGLDVVDSGKSAHAKQILRKVKQCHRDEL